MIEWNKVAKPQDDGYDSSVIAKLLEAQYGWKKMTPTSEITLVDGTVAVVPDRNYPNKGDESTWETAVERMTPELSANLDRYLTVWPAGKLALSSFLDEFWPKWHYQLTPGAKGCASGHYEMVKGLDPYAKTFGTFFNAVYVSINDLQGCAQGIYHEVGHARLESIGIHIPTHDGRLLKNADDELYDSPIRRDVKRPMSAVIQAIYSWMFFMENDLWCATLPGNARNTVDYVIGNIPKLEDGLVEIEKHVKLTTDGVAFMDGYLGWGHDVVQRAKAFCIEQDGLELFTERYEGSKLYKLDKQEPAESVLPA